MQDRLVEPADVGSRGIECDGSHNLNRRLGDAGHHLLMTDKVGGNTIEAIRMASIVLPPTLSVIRRWCPASPRRRFRLWLPSHSIPRLPTSAGSTKRSCIADQTNWV